MKKEVRQQIIGEIYEALRAMGLREHFDYIFFGDSIVQVYFPAENFISFGRWIVANKCFENIHENYKYLYDEKENSEYLEPKEREIDFELLSSATAAVDDVITKLIDLGTHLHKLKKSEAEKRKNAPRGEEG